MIKVARMVLVVLLCVSCAHAGRSTFTQQQRDVFGGIVDWEAGIFSTCLAYQIDLDKDDIRETVITFGVGSHGSQIRALKWQAGEHTVLFEDGSDTPNTTFCLAEGVPTVVLERSDSAYGEVAQLVYQWDGQAFVPSRDGGCTPEQDDLRWEDCSSASK